MAAFRLIARATARDRWRSLVALALLVAVVGAVVLAATAGAHRTATSLERFQDATLARDAVLIAGDDQLVDDLAAAAARQDWVAATAGQVSFVGSPNDVDLVTVYGGTDEALTATVDRPLVLDGRLPDADSANEVVADETARDAFDLEPGDHLRLHTYTPEDLQCLLDATCPLLDYSGPELRLEVVGITRDADALGDTEDPTPSVTASAAFTDRYLGRVGAVRSEVLIRLEDRDDLGRLEHFVDQRSQDATLVTPDEDYVGAATDAVDVIGTSLLVFAVASALAAAVTLAQAARTQILAAAATTEVVPALGLSSWGWGTSLALPVIGAGAIGAALAPVGAYLASGLFPFGVADEIEPSPGLRFDPAVLIGGPALILVLISAIALLGGRRAARRRAVRPTGRPVTSRVLGTAGLGSPFGLGTRLAFGGEDRRTRAIARAGLGAATLAVIGLVGSSVVASSTTALLDHPERWGWTWSSTFRPIDPAAFARSAPVLAREDGVEALARIHEALISIDDDLLSAYSFEPLSGDIDPTLVDGRLPEGDDEIALGAVIGRRLGLSIGDTVAIDLPQGTELTRDYHLVGTVAVPTFNDRQPGLGSVLTRAGLEPVSQTTDQAEYLIRYDDGVDAASLEDRLSTEYAIGFLGPIPPPKLSNLEETTVVMRALAAFFAALGTAGVAQALAGSLRRRRSGFATRRALGVTPGGIRRSVLWQGALIGLTAAVVGLPLGLFAGRLAWVQVIRRTGVIDRADYPGVVLRVVVPGAVLLAVLVSIVPAWLAGRPRPATALRSE